MEHVTPCFPFRVSFDPEDLRIEGNPFRVNPLSGGLNFCFCFFDKRNSVNDTNLSDFMIDPA
jgi:hypothetical protein